MTHAGHICPCLDYLFSNRKNRVVLCNEKWSERSNIYTRDKVCGKNTKTATAGTAASEWKAVLGDERLAI